MTIRIVEKPIDYPWDEIRKVIYLAHESNRERGLDIRNAHLSAVELETSIGPDGICILAMDDDKLIGTCSIAFKDVNTWYMKGRVAYLTLDAVLPEYKGQGVFRILEEKRLEIIQESGVEAAYINIAESNTIRRKIALKYGFKEVEVRYNPFNPHNYMTYCKWFTKQPVSSMRIFTHYYYQYAKLSIRNSIRKIRYGTSHNNRSKL